MTATATITNTFIDGSKIPLYIDGEVVDSKLVWTRGGAEEEAVFIVRLKDAGEHRIKVGNLVKTITAN